MSYIKKLIIWVMVLILIIAMVILARIRPANAYFTTYTTAKGGKLIDFGSSTTLKEEFAAWQKHITLTNNKNGNPVFARAKAFCKKNYPLTYETNNKWELNENDGFYYYNDIINNGESAEELLVTINDVPNDVTIKENFNVIVICETTPVLYDKDGNPYADWTGEVYEEE